MNKQELLAELKSEGFSQQILGVFSKIPREKFIPKSLHDYAYNNEPLPIGRGATISQPYTIAFMLELLELNKLNNVKQDKLSENKNNQNCERSSVQLSEEQSPKNKKSNVNNINKIKVLEIGSGCGYVLALINEILRNKCPEIYGIEIIPELVEKSRKVLKKYKNIKIIHGDGSKGLSQKAPFDRILISAACDEIPKHLCSQLKPDGIFVTPVQNSIFQIKNNKIQEFPGFVFVRLVNYNNQS